MYEDKILDISDKIFGKKRNKEFIILTHKKHKREFYVERKNKDALKFIKPKMNSFKKKIIYYALLMGILQPFLKKIKLNSHIGDVIFCAGQIKIFNFKKKEVLSFPKQSNENVLFIKSKEYQKKMVKKGFAPKILKINKQIPFSIEEFLSVFEENNFKIFKKLLEYYTKIGIKKEPSKKFIFLLAKKNKKIDILLQKISRKNTTFLITQIHGDFAKEQVLRKNDEIVFTDWNTHSGLITEDLVHFFHGEEDLLKNKEFQNCLKLYPKEVQENISDYLILNEIIRISKNNANLPLAKIRIKKLLSKPN